MNLSIIRNDELRNYALRNDDNLYIPRVKHEFARNSICYVLPHLINGSSPYIKNKLFTHSLQGFGKYVKIFMINEYVTDCQIENCYVCTRQ